MRPPAPLRAFSLTLVAGALAGAVAGIGARVAMRVAAGLAGPSRQGIVTAESAVVGDLTWSGTIAVLVIGAFVGVAGAALYALIRPVLPRRGRGLAFGFAALLLTGWTILDPSNSDFRGFGDPTLNYAMFGALFLVYGAVLAPADRWLRDRAPSGWWSYALWAPIAALGAILVLTGIVFGMDRRPVLGLAMVALVVAARTAHVWHARPSAKARSPRP